MARWPWITFQPSAPFSKTPVKTAMSSFGVPLYVKTVCVVYVATAAVAGRMRRQRIAQELRRIARRTVAAGEDLDVGDVDELVQARFHVVHGDHLGEAVGAERVARRTDRDAVRRVVLRHERVRLRARRVLAERVLVLRHGRDDALDVVLRAHRERAAAAERERRAAQHGGARDRREAGRGREESEHRLVASGCSDVFFERRRSRT